MKPKRTMSRSHIVSSSSDLNNKTFYETDDDRDSGTESDDEGAEIEELQKYMESIIHLDSRNGGGGGEPQQQRRCTSSSEQQQHQHQPQLQVTSGGDDPHHHHHQRHHHHRPRRRPTTNPRRSSPPDDAALVDSALPSDSDHNFDHHSSEEELEVINSSSHYHHHHHLPEKRKWVGGSNGGDADVVCCPVQFRTSPPAHAHKPSGSRWNGSNAIPPHELLCSASPRKRHRRTPTAIQQRPCLDFEKMQQINRVRLL